MSIPNSPTSARGSIQGLPLVRWVRRFDQGTCRLEGELIEPWSVSLGAGELVLPAGPVRVELVFRGGLDPSVSEVHIHGDGLGLRAPSGASQAQLVVLDHARVHADHDLLAWAAPTLGGFAQGVVDRLHHLDVELCVRPEEQVVVRFGGGAHGVLSPGAALTLSGATEGPPRGMSLSRPLVVGFGGEGLLLSHDVLSRTARLAHLCIRRATLHPSGRVALEGDAARPLRLAMRTGLRTVSDRFSRMVREADQLDGVRAFIRELA